MSEPSGEVFTAFDTVICTKKKKKKCPSHAKLALKICASKVVPRIFHVFFFFFFKGDLRVKLRFILANYFPILFMLQPPLLVVNLSATTFFFLKKASFQEPFCAKGGALFCNDSRFV